LLAVREKRHDCTRGLAMQAASITGGYAVIRVPAAVEAALGLYTAKRPDSCCKLAVEHER